jgi:hypothetical protein
MIMITARIVFSVLHKLFTIFRIDQAQFPSLFGADNFDPLHNAYLASVLLEAQLQAQHRVALQRAAELETAGGSDLEDLTVRAELSSTQ